MKLLLDQGLPRSTVQHFKTTEIGLVHAGEIGMATAEDQEILDFAFRENCVVITLDADFHALLAKSGEDAFGNSNSDRGFARRRFGGFADGCT